MTEQIKKYFRKNNADEHTLVRINNRDLIDNLIKNFIDYFNSFVDYFNSFVDKINKKRYDRINISEIMAAFIVLRFVIDLLSAIPFPFSLLPPSLFFLLLACMRYVQ